MKIALIGTTANCVIGFRSDLIKSMIKEGHQVYAFALDYTPETKAIICKFGATPIDYNFNRAGLNPISDIINTIKLTKTLKKMAVDVVFSYFSKPVVFGTIAAKLAGVKKVVGMLEGLGFFFIAQERGFNIKFRIVKKLQIFLYKFSIPLLDKIIFLNKDDVIDLIEANNIKTKDICILGGIGVDINEYRYAAPKRGEVSFIFVARLLAEKGIHEYIEAARITKVKYPNTRYIVLGGLDFENPGALSKDELDRLISENLIIYPGHVDNVNDWLTNSSVFVLPSYYREGVPRSIQEAMAIGRAIITTDNPGCRDTVQDGLNGYIVPIKSPSLLSSAMIKLIQNPDLVIEMGIASRRIAEEKYDSQKVNQKLMRELSII